MSHSVGGSAPMRTGTRLNHPALPSARVLDRNLLEVALAGELADLVTQQDLDIGIVVDAIAEVARSIPDEHHRR